MSSVDTLLCGVLMCSHSHCNTSWSLCCVCVRMLSQGYFNLSSPWPYPTEWQLAGEPRAAASPPTLMTHGQPWDIISEKLWLQSCRPFPGLACRQKNYIFQHSTVTRFYATGTFFSRNGRHIWACSSRHNGLESFGDSIQICHWSGVKGEEKG